MAIVEALNMPIRLWMFQVESSNEYSNYFDWSSRFKKKNLNPFFNSPYVSTALFLFFKFFCNFPSAFKNNNHDNDKNRKVTIWKDHVIVVYWTFYYDVRITCINVFIGTNFQCDFSIAIGYLGWCISNIFFVESGHADLEPAAPTSGGSPTNPSSCSSCTLQRDLVHAPLDRQGSGMGLSLVQLFLSQSIRTRRLSATRFKTSNTLEASRSPSASSSPSAYLHILLCSLDTS